MSEGTPKLRWRWIGISGFALIFSLLMAYEAFYELFIWVDGVHIPRLRSWDDLYPNLDVPTVCWTIILVSAGACVIFSTKILLNLRSKGVIISAVKKSLVISLLAAQIVAYLVALDDLLSSAGSFG